MQRDIHFKRIIGITIFFFLVSFYSAEETSDGNLLIENVRSPFKLYISILLLHRDAIRRTLLWKIQTLSTFFTFQMYYTNEGKDGARGRKFPMENLRGHFCRSGEQSEISRSVSCGEPRLLLRITDRYSHGRHVWGLISSSGLVLLLL